MSVAASAERVAARARRENGVAHLPARGLRGSGPGVGQRRSRRRGAGLWASRGPAGLRPAACRCGERDCRVISVRGTSSLSTSRLRPSSCWHSRPTTELSMRCSAPTDRLSLATKGSRRRGAEEPRKAISGASRPALPACSGHSPSAASPVQSKWWSAKRPGRGRSWRANHSERTRRGDRGRVAHGWPHPLRHSLGAPTSASDRERPRGARAPRPHPARGRGAERDPPARRRDQPLHGAAGAAVRSWAT